MKIKDPLGKEPGKDNPIRNFCWPLSGKEKEDCIQNYEGMFEEEGSEKKQDETEIG